MKVLDYVYDATGNKLEKRYSGYGMSPIITQYAGNYVYENGELQFFNTPEGYVTPNNQGGFDYIYQYKDHLGNVRLSYADTDNNGTIDAGTEILEEKNYYPFGLQHKGYNNVVSSNGNSVANRFGFVGKELNQELGLEWHDFGARNYQADLGRWMNLDPKAEEFYDWSPYNYSYNSPIFFVDPDGKSPISMILKQAAKVGLKKAMKSYIKSSIKKRLKNYGSKKWGKQLLKDAGDALNGLDSSWWEHAIEVIPVAGDVYGAASFTKKGVKVWNKLKKFEKLADNATTIAGKGLKKNKFRLR